MRITYPEAFAAPEALANVEAFTDLEALSDPEVLATPASLADPDSSVVNPPDDSSRASLTLIPKFKNLGIMGMAELLTALSLLGGIENEIGKNPSTMAFVRAFEQAFGFSFKNIYDRQRELFIRKPYNRTKTLDALKGALLKEFRKREK